MSSPFSIAATLCPDERQQLAIEALAKTKPITHLAEEYQVSRKFVRAQSEKAKVALQESFEPVTPDEAVLFHLPVTPSWLFQLMVSLVLICHCSLRGVVELLRDVFHLTVSVSTVRNRLQAAAERDEETWGCHVLDAVNQGLDPERTIADFGSGLRAGHQAVFGEEVPCHGDVFHLQHQSQGVVNSLNRQAMGATTQRQTLEREMAKAKEKAWGNRVSAKLAQARHAEVIAVELAKDVKTLFQWLNHDVLKLAGPALAERQELYDFVVAELRFREGVGRQKVSKLRKALQNQRDDILGFAQVLDNKLAVIADRLDMPLYWVRQMCLFFRKQPTSQSYWQAWNYLHQKLSWKFHPLYEAVQEAMKQTPRASSMVENLNSRLRNYFFLRKQLGPSYLNLLQFFLNHRQFMRSECEERVSKSPKELMTGESHPHWLELLGFKRFQQA